MKFKRYLNEGLDSKSLDEINELIHKNCKHYLKLTKGIYMFKRGMGYKRDKWGIKKVRQDRRPKGMNPEVFSKLNDWLEKNGHLRRDKSVIAANITSPVSMFGDVYWIFPIGKFNYTWLMAGDMNMSSSSTGWDSIAPTEFFRFGYADSIPGKFEDFFVTNSSLSNAWKFKYETWFDCKEYYYVSSNDYGWNASKKELVEWDS